MYIDVIPLPHVWIVEEPRECLYNRRIARHLSQSKTEPPPGRTIPPPHGFASKKRNGRALRALSPRCVYIYVHVNPIFRYVSNWRERKREREYNPPHAAGQLFFFFTSPSSSSFFDQAAAAQLCRERREREKEKFLSVWRQIAEIKVKNRGRRGSGKVFQFSTRRRRRRRHLTHTHMYVCV